MEKRKLSSLCLLEKGKQIDTETLDDKNIFPYVNGGIKESGFYESYNTSGDTITISEGGASCGFVNYRNDKFWCGCHCYRLTNFNVNFKYLYFALKANQKNIMDLRSGVAMPNIKKSRLEDLMINIDEDAKKQDKIVKELSELTESIGKEQTAILEFNELIKSRFIEMFGNEETIKPMDIVCSICRGASPRPISTYVTKGDGVNWIKIGDVQEDDIYINKTSEKITKEGALKSRFVKPGDFILSNSMSFGRPYILGINGCVHDGWLILSNYEKYLNPLFFYYEIRSKFVQEQFDGSAYGTCVRNLNSDLVRKVQIHVPTLSKQKQFVDFAKQVDKLKFNAQKRIDLYQELLNKKMDEYFN